MYNTKKRTESGFTLAEVLITLGIIGVVAAMTIPGLIQNNYEKATVAKLFESSSIISQTIRMAEEEYGDVESWGLKADSDSSEKIAEYLKPFWKIAIDCGLNDTKNKCVPGYNYKNLSGGNGLNYTSSIYYKIVLLNGSSVFWGAAHDYSSGYNIHIYIDTNGTAMPNTWGKDLFMFNYYGNSLYPAGSPDDKWSCTSGYGCAYYVLNNKNMKYLH